MTNNASGRRELLEMVRFPGLEEYVPINIRAFVIVPEGRPGPPAEAFLAVPWRPSTARAATSTPEEFARTDELAEWALALLVPERWIPIEEEEARLRTAMYDRSRYIATSEGGQLLCAFDATLGIPLDPTEPFLCDVVNETYKARRQPVTLAELERILSEAFPQLNDPDSAVGKEDCEALLTQHPALIGSWSETYSFEPESQRSPSCGIFHLPARFEDGQPLVLYRLSS